MTSPGVAEVTPHVVHRGTRLDTMTSPGAAEVAPHVEHRGTRLDTMTSQEAAEVTPHVEHRGTRLDTMTSPGAAEVTLHVEHRGTRLDTMTSPGVAEVAPHVEYRGTRLDTMTSQGAAEVTPHVVHRGTRLDTMTSQEAAEVTPHVVHRGTRMDTMTSQRAAEVAPHVEHRGTRLDTMTSPGAVEVTPHVVYRGTHLDTMTSTGAAEVTPHVVHRGTLLDTMTSQGAAEVTLHVVHRGTRLDTMTPDTPVLSDVSLDCQGSDVSTPSLVHRDTLMDNKMDEDHRFSLAHEDDGPHMAHRGTLVMPDGLSDVSLDCQGATIATPLEVVHRDTLMGSAPYVVYHNGTLLDTETMFSDTSSCSGSSSVYSLDSQDTALAATPPARQYGAPPEFPAPVVKVEVASMVVHEGGTGVHNGDFMNFTLNQYIGVVPGEKGRRQIDPEVIQDLVTDAVRINKETKQQFLDKTDPSNYKFLGTCFSSKEEMVKLQRRCCCWLMAITLLVSVIPLASTALYSLWSSSPSAQYFTASQLLPPVHDSNTTENIRDMVGAPRIFSRSFWVAQPSTGVLDNNSLPVESIVVCHTATESCSTTADCVLSVRYLQQFHIDSLKWLDIGYNFLIGGDGNVYEGRGWNKMGAHTKGNNNGTLGIAFIGTYNSQLPSEEMLEAFQRLVNVGVKAEKIARDYALVAQCQLKSTAAPGLALATNMSSWPHYDNTLPLMCTTV